MPKPVTSYTTPLTAAQAQTLREILETKGFDFVPRPYTLYAASKGKLNISVYEKGPKAVIQGKETEDFIKFTLEPDVLGEAKLGYEEELNPEMFQPHIGVDESGKGDFFGPLVVAGVYVDPTTARALLEAGATDSKRISSDARIRQVAETIREIPGLQADIIQINPKRYNELYEKFGNLNKLLAWGHARVIENLLERVPDCPRALSDQFANPRVLEKALQTKGQSIEIQQKTKAESDVAVAAASILARERFINWLDDQGKAYGIPLPKGASRQVSEAAGRLAERSGPAILAETAKMHFRTADPWR